MRGGAVLIALVVLAPLGAEEPPKPADPAAEREKVLARVAAASAGLKDLKADFEQQSIREGLSKPVLSSGELLYRVDPKDGAAVLLEISKPEKTFIRVTRSRMETYLPEDKQVEIIDLKENEAGARAVDATVLLYGKPREYWEAHFEVAVAPKAAPADPDELVLVPKDEGLRKTLHEIRMWVASDTALPVKVRYRYARGEEVTMTFKDVKRNPGLRASQLELKYPKDVEILRPGGEEEGREAP